jgi:hypothetical protein
MNERIREIALQVYGSAATAQEIKFAELIVKECAKLVEENMDPQNAWITPRYIKEHFGVKE